MYKTSKYPGGYGNELEWQLQSMFKGQSAWYHHGGGTNTNQEEISLLGYPIKSPINVASRQRMKKNSTRTNTVKGSMYMGTGLPVYQMTI